MGKLRQGVEKVPSSWDKIHGKVQGGCRDNTVTNTVTPYHADALGPLLLWHPNGAGVVSLCYFLVGVSLCRYMCGGGGWGSFILGGRHSTT